MCNRGTFHPLTSRKGKCISVKMYRKLEDTTLKDLQRNIIHHENEVLEIQKLINFEIKNDNMCYKDCTESLCLYIDKKMSMI